VKVLLDENLPHDFRHDLAGHDVFTVAYMGWTGVTNGELLRPALSARFDVVITKDAGIEYEQNLGKVEISLVLVRAKTNSLEDLRPLVPALLNALRSMRKGVVLKIG
jgi:hypothetical protein